MAGLVEQVMSLVADVEALKAALRSHTRVPETRWGVVTTYAPGVLRVTFLGESGECEITRSTVSIYAGAPVIVQVQGQDRWITWAPGGAFDSGMYGFTGSATAPPGWYLRDGRAISRTDDWQLFARIGTTYGVGDGLTTFNLPNALGRVDIGTGTATGAAGATNHTLGQKGGEETHALTSAENGPHAHDVGLAQNDDGTVDVLATQEGSGVAYGGWRFDITSTGGGYRKFIASAAGLGTPHNNLPPFLAGTPIIKR